MFIERLTLKNFKSFGGTHELPFAPGFTAIVGPNGSGKSNILDGLRWALGESGAARLRITRQSDLIFQGSAGLSEATETEVTLDLDDGGSRAALKRRLDASGGAVYVNGSRTRVQDLARFKQQWRLEGDKSAFIGQGEVGAAVLQKPFQRRLQLEELFGIDLYRKKRDGARDELRQASDELLRLNTLMGELRARREQIAPDLANARKARDWQSRLAGLKSALYHTRRFAEESRLGELSRRHEKARERLGASERWAALWKRALDALRERGSEYARERGRLNDSLRDIRPRLDDVLRRVTALNSEKSESEFELRRFGEEQTRLESRLKDEEKLRGELAAQTGRLTREESSLSSRLADLEDRLKERDERLSRARRERGELIEREAALLEESRQMTARAEALRSQSKEREKSLARLRSARDELVTRLTAADEEMETLEDALDELDRKRGEAAASSRELAVRAQNLRRAVARAEAELDTLIQRAEAGLYPKPVQMILSAVKLGRLKIETVPAVESFACPATLAASLEAYLGGRQYWLLVDTTEQARLGIELLKERLGGRATFLPLERCVPARHSAPPAGAGVLGRAIDLVAPLPRWLPACRHLLGDLLVVADYDTGARLAAAERCPIVTLDGEVFSPSGTVSGGKTARAVGAITLRTMIEQTERGIAADKQAQQEISRRLAAAEAAENAAVEALEAKRREAGEQKSRVEALRREAREQTEELNALLGEGASAENRVAALRESARKSADAAALARKRIEELAPLDADDAESEELARTRTQAALAAERLSAKKAELERSVRLVSDLRRELGENAARAREAVSRLAGLDARARELETERKRRESEKESVESRIAELDARNAGAAARMERRLLRSQKARAAFDAVTREELMARMDIEKTRERLAALVAANEDAFPYPDGFAPGGESADRLENSCRYVERQLRELGDVNMGALSEDASLAERLDFLGAQVADVTGGMDGLKALIADTDKQAGSLFNSALVKIDRRFDELFRRLFGGGEAHLRAQTGPDLWETGVEIVARPPGKKPLYLAQLSGGEQSLTALSLLFAAMEVARVPLAVLDEVDAALDDANLTRFAQMVVEYSKSLQVIAMTHRRQTMEHAEVMYGVTMSEPGLSQIVSVKVEQWE